MENEMQQQEEKTAVEKIEEFKKDQAETTCGSAWDGYYGEDVTPQFAAQNYTVI